MAFGKQITGDNGAFVGQYHRIRTVVYDYDAEQCHITIAHYADKQYREQEKAEIAANQAKIARVPRTDSQRPADRGGARRAGRDEPAAA